MVKTPMLFFAFIFFFAVLFIFMTLSLKLDIISTSDGFITENSLLVFLREPVDVPVNRVYVYTDRNNKVYNVPVDYAGSDNGVLFLLIHENDIPENISGNVQVDLITGQHSLLERIFKKSLSRNT
jgi:hypothetical protein